MYCWNIHQNFKKQWPHYQRNAYIDKLDDIVNKYNNAYHSSIKMKPVDVRSNLYIDSSKEISNKDPKLKVGNIVRISKYKNIFAKSYVPNWSAEVFVIKKLKILCRRHMLLMMLMEKNLLEHFTKTNCKKQIKKNLELKKWRKGMDYMLNGTMTRLIAG